MIKKLNKINENSINVEVVLLNVRNQTEANEKETEMRQESENEKEIPAVKKQCMGNFSEKKIFKQNENVSEKSAVENGDLKIESLEKPNTEIVEAQVKLSQNSNENLKENLSEMKNANYIDKAKSIKNTKISANSKIISKQTEKETEMRANENLKELKNLKENPSISQKEKPIKCFKLIENQKTCKEPESKLNNKKYTAKVNENFDKNKENQQNNQSENNLKTLKPEAATGDKSAAAVVAKIKPLKNCKTGHFITSKNTEILVTDALKKLTKKTITTRKEPPNANNPNPAPAPPPVAGPDSVVIDKQLSVTGPFKKVKCVYTILTNDQINMLRKHAQEAVKQSKIFTIRGNYNSVRHALKLRGWVEKIDMNRKLGPLPCSQVNICDLSQVLPKRKCGESQRQFIAKVERNIMSRYIEHAPCDLLWTPHKEKPDYVDQSRNSNMLINKFNRAPFTNKENLNAFLRDIACVYEEGVCDILFPRCYNVWSPEELNEFIEHFKLTACVAFLKWLVERFRLGGFDAVFSAGGRIPYSSIDFAFKRCLEYVEQCLHNDIDIEDPPRVWEHDWDAFLNHHYQLTHDGWKIVADPQKLLDSVLSKASQILAEVERYWSQHAIDGYQNLWIIKPANKCRGRGIHLSNNLKKILNIVNPSMAAKSRYVVQKYMERPLIIHHTKFDIRQWFLISNIQPLMVWMYKECYLRFSSQEYTLTNHHESVHLTNHAIQKKYSNNGKRDKRLPSENMWDNYSFQAYLRQIGKQELWLERIYPGMRKAIVASVLVSQDHMERTPNTFELFGADFMICENYYPWLIEINSNPDLGASTSVTARMCPQCLEDVIKVVIDRRNDPKADVGNFELIYRQVIPPTPAYMGLNLIIKGKQISNRSNGHHQYSYHQRKERSLQTSHMYRHRTSMALMSQTPSQVHKPMPAFNATDYLEKCIMAEVNNASPRSISVPTIVGLNEKKSSYSSSSTLLPADLKTRKSFTNLVMAVGGVRTQKPTSAKPCYDYGCNALKRHRSCGPRLPNSHCNGGADSKDAQKSKFFVASYNQQKAINSSRSLKERLKSANTSDVAHGQSVGAAMLTISKSADNIKELCSPTKDHKQLKSSKLKASKSLSPMIPKNMINTIGVCSKQHSSSKVNIAGISSKAENTTSNIHAIGKSISSWNTQYKRLANSKPYVLVNSTNVS